MTDMRGIMRHTRQLAGAFGLALLLPALAVGQTTTTDPLNAKEWTGTSQDMKEFAGTIPRITEESLDRYIRARTAMIEETSRIAELFDNSHRRTRWWRDTVRAFAGKPLAADEKIPFLVQQGYRKIAFGVGREYERRIDAIGEKELGGAMTRYQFYQLHEMVEIFLDASHKNATVKTGPGRELAASELAALEKRRADLARLRERGKSLR
jgi:hypothetical protein